MIEIEQFIKWLIWAHATFGGLALLSGLLALIVKKGGAIHKKSGRAFFYTMLISAGLALIISVLPNHESPFLFTIGLFSAYFIIGGYSALKFKHPSPNLAIDKAVAILMIMVGIVMIAYPIISRGSINIVLSAFGALGISFAVRDLLNFRNPEKLRQDWLKMHLGKMIGGYISAVTAFVVVNQFLPPLVSWLGPGVIGGFYITYWLRKQK